MKLNKKIARIIIGSCVFAAIAIVIHTWLYAPIIIYGWLGLMFVGLIYGGYMNRAYIRSEVRRVMGEWRLRQAEEGSD